MLAEEGERGEIVLYQPDDNICLEVRLEGDTVWLTQAQMAELFNVKVPAVSKHIKNIFEEGELQLSSTVSKMEIVRKEGTRVVQRNIDIYNLDVIISVGYRIKSLAGTRFRQWATGVLKQFLLRGYAIHPTLQQVEYHLSKQIEGQRVELYNLKQQVDDHRQQIDFLIRREQPIMEQLFSTGCVWDAHAFVSDLVRSASERIMLIDPFVDERTLLILDKRAEGVSCSVYTRYNKQTELDFLKHNQQCVPICKVQLSQAVHDRYLIIDNQVWLLGASVKDMGRGLTTIIKLSFTPEEILNRVK
ncbi:MAG: virulence RhuM family protein [Paludibacteraceae bacterium]|nr:DNA-binding protein [Bacteroidales bacterium]MBR6659611.1 virulence RhuM family protein [Paludibacteraceae bacterium]